MTTIKHRRGNSADWDVANPVLAAGELGVELNTRRVKVGDGVTPWSQLDYFASDTDLSELVDALNDVKVWAGDPTPLHVNATLSEWLSDLADEVHHLSARPAFALDGILHVDMYNGFARVFSNTPELEVGGEKWVELELATTPAPGGTIPAGTNAIASSAGALVRAGGTQGPVIGETGGAVSQMALANYISQNRICRVLYDLSNPVRPTLTILETLDAIPTGNSALHIGALYDVVAPANTPAGKVLGTVAEGSWGPVDPMDGPEGPIGPEGPVGTNMVWLYPTPTTGVYGVPWRLPFDSNSIKGGLVASLDTAPTSSITVNIDSTDGTIWTPLYSVNQSIPAGVTLHKFAVPDVLSLPPNAMVRTRIVTAPTASAVPLTVVASQAQNSATAATASHTLTIPAGGAPNDTVLLILGGGSSALASVPSGWTLKDSVVTDSTTPHARIYVLTSSYSNAGTNKTFSFTAGSPMVAWVSVLQGVEASAPIRSIAVGTNGNGSGSGGTNVSGSAPRTADDYAVVAWVAREGANNFGFTSAITPAGSLTGGGTLTTETTRSATTNLRMDLLHGKVGTSGTLGPYTNTLSGGTGSTGFLSWVWVVLTLAQSLPAGPGSNLILQAQAVSS